jgi:glycerol-3-phosphate dehydrogenase
MPFQTNTQIAIIGGGVCGLWLLNQFSNQGYQTLLFEKDKLGSGQSLASQGMIHGGIKYTLGGFSTPASESIAQMPSVWRDCINRNGQVDLSGSKILSETYHMFSDGALASKVTAFFGSKSLRGRINSLDRNDYPHVFDNARFKGALYALEDLVLDTPSLIQQLSQPYAASIYQDAPSINTDAQGKVTGITLATGDIYIFAAGAGNQALIRDANINLISMQRRPLHQVVVKGKLPTIYAHAVSLRAAAKPRVTFTTHKCKDGESVWYLGGNLAETGVGKSSEEQIQAAQKELSDLLPWVDLTKMKWSSFNIDRAEPSQNSNTRPDFPFVEMFENVMVCWPTKLTLTPMLANLAAEKVSFSPKFIKVPSYNLPHATIGKAPWDDLF